MVSGAARTATGITVSIARDPALVRTVRLVAAAVARRTAGGEEFVEEVRLAVGEACALLVGSDPAHPETTGAEVSVAELVGSGATGPVEVSMRLEDRFRVVVRAAGEVVVQDPPTSDIDGVEPWSLLRGLMEDFVIVSDADGTALSMSWPLG